MKKFKEGDVIILKTNEEFHQPLCEIVEVNEDKCVVIDSLDKTYFASVEDCKEVCATCSGSGKVEKPKLVEKNPFGDTVIEGGEIECPSCEGARYSE